MSVPLQSIERTRDIAAVMADLGRAARAVARTLALASTQQKNEALRAMARALRAETDTLLKANAEDVAEARAAKMSSAFIDRLLLDPARIDTMARGIEVVAGLDDPVGQITDSWTRPNGMTIERVRVPLGVVAIIYESRPNVTADAGALCLMSGNAAILRGGSEAIHSSRAIHAALAKGIAGAGLPADAVQLVPTVDRAAVGALLRAAGLVDIVVPRGGKSLVARVQEEARVPVLAHLDGLCHSYVDGAADPAMAKAL